tara:strand:- start:1388 stop:1555 length:168 start_codon:yes stop_codon:yes gene_type:complete
MKKIVKTGSSFTEKIKPNSQETLSQLRFLKHKNETTGGNLLNTTMHSLNIPTLSD